MSIKLKAVAKKFDREFTRDGSSDYKRCRTWLMENELDPNQKLESGKGIVPYLVHKTDRLGKKPKYKSIVE